MTTSTPHAGSKTGRKFAIAAIAGAIFTLSAGASLAASGYATGNVNVRTGPGTGYSRVDTLQKGEAVEIGQCRDGWCYVTHSGPDGWVSSNYLGQAGNSNTRPHRPRGNSSEPSVGFSFGFGSDGAQFGFSFGNGGPTHRQPRACFYSGANYTGKSVCLTADRDLGYVGRAWDDRVSSVRVYNGASVTMCQHPNYGGFCRTTSRNEPALGPWLNDQVSSVRVD